MTRAARRTFRTVSLLLAACTLVGCARRMPPTDDPVPPKPPAPPSAASARRPPPPPEPPPSPQIVVDDAAGAVGAVEEQLRRCEALGSELTGRDLGAEQRTQLDSARRFLADAREALGDDDISRAEVLAAKGCQLVDAIRGVAPGE